MSKIALIFGAGARIGQASAEKFLSAGYKVVTVARTPRKESNDNTLHLTADLNDPTTIEPIFNQVQQKWGPPDVVIFNASAAYFDNNPLSTPLGEFTNLLNINTVSPYAAASIGYARNPKFTFLYTGNALNNLVLPRMATAGAGKAASAHWIQAAAISPNLRPAKFYYVDQRDQKGEPAYNNVNGPAHAELFLKLAEQEEQGEGIVVFRA